MSETVIVAILSLVGTLLGSLFGILAANKLSNYRIEQLEKKVEKHNTVVERMFIAEGHIEELQHRVASLEMEE